MSIVGDFVEAVGDIAEGAVDLVGSAVKSVFKLVGNVVKKVGDTVVSVVKGALKDPVGTIAKVAAVATGNAWALPLIDGATVVAKGGSFGDALKTAAISYATGKAANFVGTAVGRAAAESTSSAVVGKIVGAGAGASTVAIITGQDPVKAFATGGITAGVPAVLGKIDGFADLQKNNPTTATAISNAVAAQLTGKNPTDALINGVIEATGIVNKAMQQFDPNNKLTAAEKSILSNALLASTTAAVQGKDVSAAMSASLTQAGIKALGDMVTSGFAKSGNAVGTNSEALDKNAAAIEKNLKSQKSTAAEFDKVNGELEGKIAEQNRLYDVYTAAKDAADKDQESEDKYNKAKSALDAYNKYATSLNKDYEEYYKPTLSDLEKKLSDLGTEYSTLSKESKTINSNLKTAIDATTEGAKSAQATTNREIVMALDPKFDAAAYAKLNNVKSEDAYEDYLSKGQFAGAITNYDSYVSQKLKAVEEYDKDFNKEEYEAAIAAVMGAKDASAANTALNKIAAEIDAGVTTRSEAIQLLKDAYSSAGMSGYQPSEAEITSLMEQTDAQSYTTAIRTADLRSVSFDGAGYASQSDAATAAKAAGYNNYEWNGKNYLLEATPDTRAIEDARIRLATEALKKQGKTILTATDSQLKSVMDQIDKVPTKHLSSATLQDVLSGKYTTTDPDGTLRLEVAGRSITKEDQDAGRASNMLPDGYQLATMDQVWGEGHTDKAEVMVLPDGTVAWVVTGQRPLPSAIKSAGDVQDLIKTDPEAWLNLAAQYEKDVDLNMSDFFVQMANSAMLGAYATGNKEFGDNVKQTLSIATQAVGEQTKSLANFFSSVTGTSYDNALAKAGKALQDWGAANQTGSTVQQEKNITSAVANAKGVTEKIKAFVSASMDNPGGFATMIAKEGIQEILPMWAAKAVYNMGRVAYYGANAFMNGMESWGSNAGDTYAAAIKQGMSESDARATASKVGLQSAIITFVTDGVGDIPMLKVMAGDVIKGSLAGTAKAGVTNGVTEYFDEMLSNASQQYALTGKVNWDQATTAGTIGMGIGAGTASGLTLGVAINENAIVAKDVNGKDMTLAQFLAGDKVANMSTFNVNASVGVAKDGDAVTIGSIISMPMADGVNYETVKAGLPSVLTNQNIVIGKDALGDNVTLSQLMGQVTEKQDFDSLYTSLLNTTKEQREEAQTDFLSTTLSSLGYKPTKEEISSLISASPGGAEAIKQAATTYADKHTVTYDEAKKMLSDAYTAQGFSSYKPTDAEIKKFMASGATVDPTEITKQVGTFVGGNTVTAAEAEKIFKDTYGYKPSKEEIAQFTAVINQETQATNIGAYVDPRQVTTEEARQYLLDNGYQGTPDEIKAFVGQYDEELKKSEIAEWADPRVVSEQEVRDALKTAGFNDATDAMVESLTGQYEEAKLAGMTKDALPGFIYEALKGQVGGLETGLETLGDQFSELSADVKAKYDTLTQGQKDLADQLVQQGLDLNTAIETAVGSLQEDVNAKYETLTQSQKDLADQLTQQGVDLNNAIDIASKQNQEQIQELNKNLQDQIGTQGRTATQEDVDALTKMLAGQQDINQAYDVNQDKQITQEDLDLLNQIVSGTKTDWNAPAGSVWAPTGLYGQLYESEQQRKADLASAEEARKADAAATEEAIRKASIANQRTTLGTAAAGQVQNLIGNLPAAYRATQQTVNPVYAGEMTPFDFSSPLDTNYFSLSSEKQGSQIPGRPTKIATGGYLDDLLKLLK